MSYLQKLLEKKKIILFQQDRFLLDNFYLERFQEIPEAYDMSNFFETEPVKGKKKVPMPSFLLSNFRYFMDGSRKTYKVGDIITPSNKFMPVVAGQVRAGCCFRDDNGRMHLYKNITKENYLFLSNAIQDDDFQVIKSSYEQYMNNKLIVTVDKYDFNKFKEDSPTNAAVARIHQKMLDAEINLLTEMVQSNALDTDNLLILDGSLQFLSQKFDPRIFYNVIGVSKSFNPNHTGGTSKHVHIGTLLAKLEFGERTPVIKTQNDRYTYGVWYLKIRDVHDMKNPLEGVIKVEKIALSEQLDNGFESSVVDNISAFLISERNPTCHGNDERWPNHLYPVYLTEKLLKSSFFSDVYFMNLL